MPAADLPRRLAAEALGTGLLVATVVGAGTMAANLGAEGAVALMANAMAAGAVLFVLITLLGPVSGGHFNPAVTLVLAPRGRAGLALAYIAAQIAGGAGGSLLAHAMFELPLLQTGQVARAGQGQWLAEGIATFGLVATILGAAQVRPGAVAQLVALWIVAAYWFTASTSFANPAVTLARALTAGGAGIRPLDVPGFVLAQLAGAALALVLCRWLYPERTAA